MGNSVVVLDGTNTYSVTATTPAGCVQTSASVMVSSIAAGTWLGNSNNWIDPSNWCGGIPTTNSNVVIRSNAAVLPIVGGNAVVNNITIPSGITLPITGSNKLTLYGNQLGAGTITGGCASTLELVGGSMQSIGKVAVGNLVINNGNHVVLSDRMDVCNSLTMTNGNIVAGSHLVNLASTASKPIENATSRIIGRVRAMGRQVGQGSLDILGIQLAAGTDDLDTVFVERREATATFGAFSGIGYTWSIRAHRQPTSGRSIKLSWLPSARNNNNMASVQVWRRPDNGTSWTKVGPKQNLSASVGSYGLWVNTNSFSDWTASGDNNPLPVTWLSFVGSRINGFVKLQWITAQEQDNAGFVIERSTNGQQFDSIGFVAGNGNTSTLSQYQFEDRHQQSAYYRLRQVDLDGKATLSQVVHLPIMNKLQLTLFPNPAKDQVMILGADGTIEYEIFGADGKLVQSGTTINTIDLNQLPAGLYQYRLKTGADQTIGKLVKQ